MQFRHLFSQGFPPAATAQLAGIVRAFSILAIINDKTCYQVRALVAIAAGWHDGGQLVSAGFWWEQTIL